MAAAAGGSGAPPEPVSTTVSVTVVGTPSATPEAEPNLLVMSLRTMPLSVRTFTPLEPSPGNGPAVSSGMAVAAAAAVVAVAPDEGDDAADVEVDAEEDEPFEAQAAR